MRIALVDLGSFVLPYDFHFAMGLIKNGHNVSLFCSRTAYNNEFAAALQASLEVECHVYNISTSVASTAKSFLSYVRALKDIYQKRNEFDLIIFQFPKIWPLEFPLFLLIRRKLSLLIHNPVPHGFARKCHLPTAYAARIAGHLIFASAFSMRDFLQRYGNSFQDKSICIQHGTLAPFPFAASKEYNECRRLDSIIYWSNIKPYKGVELLLSLAENREPGYLPIEIHGKWDKSLKKLKSRFVDADVLVNDSYLDHKALAALLERNAIFVLPYVSATQSGALYTLLYSGRIFIASDCGDMGDFLRAAKLEGLIIMSHTTCDLCRCIEYAQNNLPYIHSRLAIAQQQRTWETIIAKAI